MSQPGPGSQPGALNQAEQQQLIQDIGRVIVRSIPPGWQEVSIEYRAVGSHSEFGTNLMAPNGTLIPIAVPTDAETLFARLRDGMHQLDRGTWLSALYRLRRPSSYSVDFNGDYEPQWRTPPPPAEFAAELRRYPRAGANIPAWLADRAGIAAPSTPDPLSPATGQFDLDGPAASEPIAPGQAEPAPRTQPLRTTEVFDSADESGRPVTDRPAVNPAERDIIAEYLEQAPVVLAARSFDTDLLDPNRPSSVPLTFHTDGTWVWPGAVGYYLRRHDVPPESALVTHVRERGFRVPEVDEHTRERAVALITGERAR